MDDTNPTKEDTKYVEALKDAVDWLGFDFGDNPYFTSDYFPKIYDYAVTLIKMGKAYVDSLTEEEIREYRGTVIQAGKRSKFAQRSDCGYWRSQHHGQSGWPADYTDRNRQQHWAAAGQ